MSSLFKTKVIFFLIAWTFAASMDGWCLQELKVSRRGLFVSVIQEPPTLSSRSEIFKLIDYADKSKIDTLFVQIYRANKAWFPSHVGDSAPYLSSVQGVGEDPLKLLLDLAHQKGIEVHAWMNLLSLSANTQAPLLKKYGYGILTQKPGEKRKIEDYKIDSQYFLEPSDSKVRSALRELITEVLTRYPNLDGLQFDYIRYPDSQPFYGYSSENINEFRKVFGRSAVVEESNPQWKQWRRDQVTELVKILCAQAKKIRPSIQLSTTGCAPYSRAYHEAFQDWAFWLDSGLVDFITMMSYPPDLTTFEKYVAGAKQHTRLFSKVNLGIGAYKLVNAPDVFNRQIQNCEKTGSRGCIIFHYGDLEKNSQLGNVWIRSNK